MNKRSFNDKKFIHGDGLAARAPRGGVKLALCLGPPYCRAEGDDNGDGDGNRIAVR